MRSIFRPALLALSLFAGLPLWAQASPLHPAVETGTIPTWTNQPELPPIPAKPAEDPSGQNFLLYDRQINIATAETYVRRVFQIVSDEGRRSGAQVEVSFDPSYQSVTLHHLRLRRGGDTIDKLNLGTAQILQRERDLDRQLYLGTLTVLSILDDVRIGDVIDVCYTIKGFNPVFGDKFSDVMTVGWGVPMQKQQYRLLTTATRLLRSKQQGQRTLDTRGGFDGSVMEYVWTANSSLTIEFEERTPSWVTVYPYIEVSEFTDWAEVARWAAPMYTVDDKVSPLLGEAVARIEKSTTDVEQRIVAALAFVQEEIRYLGIEMGASSHRPHEPEEVLRRRFGDCKDKARLLTAMIKHLGGDAVPALVHSDRGRALPDALPSPYAFDHAIVEVRSGNKRYLVDPTMSYQRGSSLELRHVGSYLHYLPLADGVAALAKASYGKWDSTLVEIDERFDHPKFDEPATLTVTTRYAGQSADHQRAYFATNSRDQIARTYLNFYTRTHTDVQPAKPIEVRDEPAANQFVVIEHYTIGKLFVPTSNAAVIRAEFHPGVIDDYLRPGNVAQRRYPLKLSHPARIAQSITVQLPEDWPAANESTNVTDPAFTLKTSNVTSGRTLKLNYEWETHADEVSPSRLAEFTGKVRSGLDLLGYQLTWNKKAGELQSSGLNWPMVLLAVGVLVVASYFFWNLIRRRNPVPGPPPLPAPADPYSRAAAARQDLDGIGGWLILVAVGIVLRPLMLLSQLNGSEDAYFDHATWHLLTSPDSPSYHALYAPLLAGELVVNVALLVFSVAIIILFFRRSYLLPRAMQVFLAAQVPIAIYSIWASHALGTVSASDQYESYRHLTQGLVGAAIWIPYFSVSRRVKATFTR